MTTTDRSARLPRPALVVAALAVIAMLVWSVVQWPEMADQVVTRESDGRHGTSMVTREVTALAMPLALLGMAALLAVTPMLDAKLMAGLRRTSAAGRRASARVLGAFVVGLSVLFPALHVAFVALQTGSEPPVTEIVGSAVGVLLVVLGLYLPLARPDAETVGDGEEGFRAALGPAYRLGGLALVVVGVGVLVMSLLLPAIAVIVAVGGVALIFVGIGVTAAFRAWRR